MASQSGSVHARSIAVGGTVFVPYLVDRSEVGVKTHLNQRPAVEAHLVAGRGSDRNTGAATYDGECPDADNHRSRPGFMTSAP